MTKHERELDLLSGPAVVVRWPNNAKTLFDIHREIIAEVDRRDSRVPLDLRSVEGCPIAIVQLVQDCAQYARQRGKVISVLGVLPAMRQVLREGGGDVMMVSTDQDTALSADRSRGSFRQQSVNERIESGIAAAALEDASVGGWSPPPASPAIDLSTDRSPKSRWRRMLDLAAVVIIGVTGLVIVQGLYFWFFDDTSPVIVNVKSFEAK